VRHERAERAVPAFCLVECRAEIGGALLQDRPDEFLVRDDACLYEVITQFLISRPVKVIGQQVVTEHEFARYAQDGEDDRGHPAAAVLPAGAVVEPGQSPGNAQQPQRGAEHLSLPGIGDEPPVDLHHERGRPPVTELAPLQVIVAARDDLVHPGQVPAGHRHANRRQRPRQPVGPGDQHLARCAEVDHGTQVEPGEHRQIGIGQRMQRVPAVQPSPDHAGSVCRPVAPDVAHVDRTVQLYMP
jgi:hypothetical protein